MAIASNFAEEECFDVFWKIKNFNYSWKAISSPHFSFLGERCYIRLEPTPAALQCRFSYGVSWWHKTWQISFLTGDGSAEETKSDDKTALKVPNEILFGKRLNSFLPNGVLTIRCRIPGFEHKREAIFLRSKIDVKRRCFVWTLENFIDNPESLDMTVEESDRFGDMKLNLKPIGAHNVNEQFCLEVSRSRGESCLCVLEVSVQRSDGRAVDCGSGDMIFRTGQQTWAFTSFIRNSKLVACKHLLRTRATISFHCEFALTLGLVSDKDGLICYYAGVGPSPQDFGIRPRAITRHRSSDSVVDLQIDLKVLLDDGTLCDATLQVGSEEIWVHKSILSARSPVFKSMFATDKKKAVSVSDLDVETVRRLLLYMYTNAIIDRQWGSVSKLYAAADKYQVLRLKQKCASILKADLSASNVCELLLLAHSHHDADLEAAACDFICKNDSEVFATAAWKELEQRQPSAACLALREVLLKKRELAQKLIGVPAHFKGD